ncbi:unnamed protein product, partial [Polarella glacialis]
MSNLQEGRLVPDKVGFNSLASACAVGRQPEQALKVLQGMRDLKVEPDVVTFGSLVSACEKGQLWERSLQLLLETGFRGIAFDVVLCSAAVSACEKGLKWQRALHLAASFQDKDVAVNEIACNAQISACARGGEWARALWLLFDMRRAGSIVSYNSAAAACQAARHWQGALLLLHAARRDQLQPDAGTFAAATETLDLAGRLGMLPSLLAEASVHLGPSSAEYSGKQAAGSELLVIAAELLEQHGVVNGGAARSCFRNVFASLHKRLAALCCPSRPLDQASQSASRLLDSELARQFSLGSRLTVEALHCVGLSTRRSCTWGAQSRLGPRRWTARSEAVNSFEGPTAHSLAAWIGSSLWSSIGEELLCTWRSTGYGGDLPQGHMLLPVLVQHDRSRHAERVALLGVLQ